VRGSLRLEEPRLRAPRWPFRLNRASPQAVGLVGWYPVVPLKEKSSNALTDLSGFHRHIGVSGDGLGPEYELQANVFGGYSIFCPDVTDVGDRLKTTDAVLKDLPLGDFSVALWAQRSAFASTSAAISFSGTDDWIIYPFDTSLGNGPRVFWRDKAADLINVNDEPYPAGVPVRLLFTSKDGNDHRLYANGRLVGTSTGTGTAGPFTELEIGHFAGGQDFLGTLWDIRLYNRALSAGEAWADFAPQTRYDLYDEVGVYSVVKAAAVGGGGTILPFLMHYTG
jgi:hypothetical protein